MERNLRLICDRHRRCFAGILCVVDLDAEPELILDWLSGFLPPEIDFLLPIVTRDKALSSDDGSTYALWLGRAFRHWLGLFPAMRVRLFEELATRLLATPKSTRPFFDPSEVCVIEADGSLHMDDSLRVIDNAYTDLGLSLSQCSLDSAEQHPKLEQLRREIRTLPDPCAGCEHALSCHGGFPVHRYSAQRSFNNPSWMCESMKNLFRDLSLALSIKFREAIPHA